MVWLYNDKPFLQEQSEEYFGFVYIITNLDTDKKYIGKKFFTKAKTKIVNKRKKRSRVQSDWLDYYGSNKILNEEVSIVGKDKFRRDIVKLCKSKGECSYWESKLQFENDVLYSDQFYNDWIMCKISRSHLRSK